ncbi:LOW QUALITY PROTEIN: acylphosphatase-2 [Drosophila albomicans]|uniref:Acylphosphatase n=2 Tax=nasuta subgroup TaxID=32307 RepID=A0A6P8W1I6_DROAB|nr:LOW QUALITY PROTEIN: acylphosphatase-2 [Drosophila albomicans]
MNTKIKTLNKAVGNGLTPITRLTTDIPGNKVTHDKKIYSSMFEIFGRVQGVYFRKHTLKKAKELGLNGWCMNTQNGTVKGILEGPQDLISEMKLWLQHKGSPRSIIEKAIFTPNEPIANYNFHSFTVRR